RFSRDWSSDVCSSDLWYDEALQSNLRRDGWPTPTRTQSMLFANIAMGESRPARLAANLGITRQSMSEMIATLVEQNILVVRPDRSEERRGGNACGPRS